MLYLHCHLFVLFFIKERNKPHFRFYIQPLKVPLKEQTEEPFRELERLLKGKPFVVGFHVEHLKVPPGQGNPLGWMTNGLLKKGSSLSDF